MKQQSQDHLPGPPARDAELSPLLAAAARGDAQAFERFYDATVRDAISLAVQLVSGPLEEVLTAAYLQAWRCRGRFDPQRDSAMEWILAIVREQALHRGQNSPSA